MTIATEHSDAAIPRTAAWVVDGVYRSLDVTDALLGHLAIPYSIVAGTLLGAVRHRGMIPWDVDADVAIRQQDVALLLAEAAAFLQPRGFGFCATETFVMKIFPLDGRRTSQACRYPYVDVFAMSVIDGAWAYDEVRHRRNWPNAFLELGSFDNLRRCEFGALRLSAVSEAAALKYVKRAYGQDWSTPKKYGWPTTAPSVTGPRVPPVLAAPPISPHHGPAVGPSQDVTLDVDEVDAGLVIFQRYPERVHHLNNTAALVFLMSTGASSAMDMAVALQEAFDLIAAPLAETTDCIDRLVDLGVLRELPDLTADRPAAARHRRSFLRGLVAASFAAPTVRTFSGLTARPTRSRSAPAGSTDSVARGEEVVLVLSGFGVGISVSDTTSLAIADRIAALVPAEMIAAADASVQIAYVVEPGRLGGVSVGVKGQRRREFFTASDAVAWLRAEIDEAVASRATEEIFVHAGVVGWRGRAILIPGRSCTGKTTLVAALVDKGAVYYSDDYAPISPDGRVCPYARAPSVRRAPTLTRGIDPALRGQARPPLPISLVVATSFQAGVGWQPTVVQGAAAMLGLLDNVIMAREHPRRALAAVNAIASNSVTLSGARPEACEIVGDLLERLDEAIDGEVAGNGTRPARTIPRAAASSQMGDDVVQSMRVDTWTGEIVSAFAEAGVRPILLKGPATVRWLYPEDPFRRTYCDADLLVAPEDHATARRILVDRGLAVQGHPRLRADGHHALTFRREADGATVDLHHTLHGMLDVPSARVWETARRDAESMIVGGSRVAVLGPTMRLLHVALHVGATDAPGDRAWTDLTRALKVTNTDEWEAALDLAKELGVTHELAARLRLRDEATWLLQRLGPQPRAMRYRLVAAVDEGRAPATVLSIDRFLTADGIRAKARYARAKLAVSQAELTPPAAWVLARSGSLRLARCAHAVVIANRLPGALTAWRRERRRDPPATAAP